MKINVLTYNMSWATQSNKVLGSEADFVKACQKKYVNLSRCYNYGIQRLLGLRSLTDSISASALIIFIIQKYFHHYI